MKYKNGEVIIRQVITRISGLVVILLAFAAVMWFESQTNKPLDLGYDEKKYYSTCFPLFTKVIEEN